MSAPRSLGSADIPMRTDALPAPVEVSVIRESDVVYARELTASMAARVGFGRSAVHRLATAVSELGNNLVGHARHGGQLTATLIDSGGRRGIEVVAEDDGPGIADVELAMTDGYSTNRGLGSGLPGCRRLMDEFTLTSTAGQGTRVMARLWLRQPVR
jgi:serine/threonine-protein kinase RsbT